MLLRRFLRDALLVAAPSFDHDGASGLAVLTLLASHIFKRPAPARRRVSGRLAVSVGLFLLVGCLDAPGDGGDDDSASWSESDALAALDAALVNFHDHSDPLQHPGISWRIEDVFYTTLPMAASGAVSPPSEFALWDHYAFVSMFHPSAGFAILDLSDPARPVHAGYFDAGTAYTNDVEVSEDGHWAFVPTQPTETSENDPSQGGLPYVADRGVQVADVSDPTDPTLAAFFDATGGGQPPFSARAGLPGLPLGSGGWHRLDIHEIDGAIHVFGTNNHLARVDILRFDPEPVPRLTFVGSYQSPDGLQAAVAGQDGWPSTNVHDVTVGPDPLEGFPLLAVAHWMSGVHFLDVSDPADPELLGVWDGFVDVLPGNVHNVEFTEIEGRRIAVAVPEYPSDYERQGIVWIIDATDFANPKTIGTWSLPGIHPVEGGTYVFTSDRTEIRNGTLYVPHMHAGVMVLDISTLEKARHPELVGYILPPGVEAIPYLGFTTNPVVYDAIPDGRYLYYTDLLGGFHVAEMDDAVWRR